MKKFKIFKALFAAAALAFALPSCSDLSSGGSSAQVAPDGKVAVSLSLTEGYRSIISSLSLTGLKGTLTITPTDEGTTETVQTISIDDISAFDNGSTVAYLTADATYKFGLEVYKETTTSEGGSATTSKTNVLASETGVTKKITASDAAVSITLVPVTDATVAVALNVSLTAGGSTAKASDFGVKSVRATVYSDASLAEDKKVTGTDLQFTVANAKDASDADIDGSYVVSGTITTGATRWVKIELLADDETVLGSKTVAIYGIPTGEFSEADTTLTVAIKQYKATVVITSINTVDTTEDATAKDLVLENTAFSDATETITYTAATKSTDETTATYTAYVPYGTYKFTIGNGSGNVTNVKEVTVDADKILTSISVAWNDDHYEKNESNQVTTTAKAHYVNNTTADDLLKEIKINLFYDGETESSASVNPATSAELIGFDATSEDAQTLTVSYLGKTSTNSLPLTLKEDSISSIAVKTKPTNLSYTVGNSINLSGLVLTLTYESTATENVTYTVTNEETGVADNEVSFGLSFYSDSACTTSAGDDFTAFQAGTYYVKVTYAGKTSDAFSVTISAGTFTASVTITEDGNAATGTYTVTFVNSEDTNSPISATAGTESDTTHVYSASGLAADKTYAVYIRGVDSGKTVTSAAPNVTCDYLTVYVLSGESAIINLGKTNIAEKAYLVTSDDLNYNSSAYENIGEGEDVVASDNYPNFKNSGKTLTVKIKGVAAFDLHLRGNSSCSFYLTVAGTKYTVPNTSSSSHTETFNTGTTDETTIVFDGIDGTMNNYMEYLKLYNTSKDIPATSVVISGKPVSSLVLTDYPSGTTYNDLVATVSPSWHTSEAVVWSSATEATATIVSSTGKIQPLAEGTTVITATVGTTEVTDSFTLTVAAANVAVTGVTLNKSSTTISRWNTETLTAAVSPDDATDKSVTWTSSDTSVATVTDGLVTAVAPGTATITVKSVADETKTASCEVIVTQVVVSGNFELTEDEHNSTALTGKLLSNKMYTTAKVDSNGIYAHRKISANGFTQFVLDSSKTLTITYNVASNKEAGLVVSTSDGTFTVSEDSAFKICGGTGNDELSKRLGTEKDGADTNTQAAYTSVTGISSTKTEYTAVITLSAGTYKLYGSTTNTSAKISAITFADQVNSSAVRR